MKIHHFLFLILCCIINIQLYAAGIEYHYDAGGNRIARQVVLLRSAQVDTDEDSISEPPIVSKLGPEQVSIYPNPTKGMLSVAISKTEEEEKDCQTREVILLLYSTAGEILQRMESLDREIIVDLSDYAAGQDIIS